MLLIPNFNMLTKFRTLVDCILYTRWDPICQRYILTAHADNPANRWPAEYITTSTWNKQPNSWRTRRLVQTTASRQSDVSRGVRRGSEHREPYSILRSDLQANLHKTVHHKYVLVRCLRRGGFRWYIIYLQLCLFAVLACLV